MLFPLIARLEEGLLTDLALVSEPGQVTDVAMEKDLGISIGTP